MDAVNLQQWRHWRRYVKHIKKKYPLVQIVLHTATADAVYEMMNKGLVDIALFMEPVDTEGLDYIRITDCDHWCVGMRPDDPLAEKEFIKKRRSYWKALDPAGKNERSK